LYWDTTGGRDRWRANRLQMDRAYPVKAPIRYGRRSKNGTYTMVFGTVPSLGQARVVPCKNAVTSLRELIGEAEWLWSAELRAVPISKDSVPHKTSSEWGCVGMLANPNARVPEGCVEGWACRFRAEDRDKAQRQHFVDGRGLLQMSWPDPVEAAGTVPLDLLLATTNSPTLTNGSFPSADEIANAWKLEPGGSAQYFRKNREHQIFTFEDEAIESHLREEHPGQIIDSRSRE
jgi:hypothetical protein